MNTELRAFALGSLAVLLAVLAFPHTLHGDVFQWIADQGSWHNASNWDRGRVPQEEDTAIVDQGEVHFGTAPAYCWELQLGSAPGGTGRMVVETGANLQVGEDGGIMYLGRAGVATFIQTGGTVEIGSFTLEEGNVLLGDTANAKGYLELSGSASYFSCASWVHVGNRGQGTFTQTGGRAYLPSCISAGNQEGSYGLIRLSGGTLETYLDPVVVGLGSGSRGSLALSGEGTIIGGHLYVGSSGEGTLTQTGGCVGPGMNVSVGGGVGGTGTYHLSAGLVDSPSFVVGDYGNGRMIITGGSALGGNTFDVGRAGVDIRG